MACVDWDIKLVSHNNLIVCHSRDEEALDAIEHSGYAVGQFGHSCTIQVEDRENVVQLLTNKGFRVAE